MAGCFLREHTRHKTVQPVYHAHEVDIEDPLPVGDGALPTVAADQHTCIVEQDIDFPEALQGTVDRVAAIACKVLEGALGEVRQGISR